MSDYTTPDNPTVEDLKSALHGLIESDPERVLIAYVAARLIESGPAEEDSFHRKFVRALPEHVAERLRVSLALTPARFASIFSGENWKKDKFPSKINEINPRKP